MKRALAGLVLAFSSIGSSRAQSTASADAGVSLISPAQASILQATELLFSSTPGVLTVTIPGGSGSSGSTSMDLTTSALDAQSGTLIFTSSSADAAAMSQLVAQFSRRFAQGSMTPGLVLRGFIKGQGVQIVMIDARQNGSDGSGTLQATITFD